MYNKLMDCRSDADYNNEFFFDKEKAKEFLIAVEKFNQEIKALIDKKQPNKKQ